MIGVLLFGASLFLVGQMYHVQAHDPLAFLVWSAVAGAAAVVIRSAPLAGLAALTFETWLVFEVLSLSDSGFSAETALPALLALLGAAFYAAATAARPWLERFQVTGPFRTLGLVSCAFGLFVLTFPFVLEYAEPRAALDHRFVEVALWALVAAVGISAAVPASQWRRRGTAPWEATALGAVPVVVLLFAYGTDEPRPFEGERDVLAEALLFKRRARVGARDGDPRGRREPGGLAAQRRRLLRGAPGPRPLRRPDLGPAPARRRLPPRRCGRARARVDRRPLAARGGSRVSARTSAAFLALVAIQVLVPLGIVGWNELALATGTQVRLATAPVDPNDLFRGRYVTLRYEISRVPLGGRVDPGQTVYVPLSEGAAAWIASGPATTSRPEGGVFIRGRVRGGTHGPGEIEVEYGIETYYADEEEAQALERQAGSLLVDVVLDDDGKARIEEIAGRR